MNFRNLISNLFGSGVSPSPDMLAGATTVDAFAGSRAGESKLIGAIPFRWCPETGPRGFLMGSPGAEAGRAEDEVQHRVVLTRGFWLSETLLTHGQWQAIIGTGLLEQAAKALADDREYDLGGKLQTTRDFLRVGRTDARKLIGDDGPNIPIHWVHWEEAVDYCARLTQRELHAKTIPPGWTVVLPTEAEWEWACRAGTTTATYAGEMEIVDPLTAPVLESIAWYGGNKREGKGGPMPVGLKRENAWGFKDMLGNVWEWCADWYADYPAGPVADSEGPATGGQRVLRGGNRYGKARDCRAANRTSGSPELRNGPQGVRLAVKKI